MEGMVELPEIKSEINSDDFGAHNNVVAVGQNSTTPQPQQQQSQQESANNCQWVSSHVHVFPLNELDFQESIIHK